jgi:hypothetical protein
MPVGFRNLSGQVQGLLNRPYPDIGQTFYVVDSNYRTAAQGWSKSDGTGPLELYDKRNPGYVFRTGDYSTDGVCIQAAIDAMVDFRGDALYFTPGAYSIAATALAVNVPDARWLGSPVSCPMSARASITAAVAAAIGLTAAADRMEFAFLKFIPLTASHIFGIATGAEGLHFHNFYYDATGIAANVATQMVLAAGTMDNSAFTDFVFRTDAAQGPLIELDGLVRSLLIARFQHFHQVGTLATSLLQVDDAGSTGITVGPGHGQIGGTGGVDHMIEHADMTSNATNITIRQFTGSVGYCTNATLIDAASAAAEADYVDSWIATVGGGAGGALYIGTS